MGILDTQNKPVTKMRDKNVKLCAGIAILLVLGSSGYAQSNTGIIRGTVTDKTSAVVSGGLRFLP